MHSQYSSLVTHPGNAWELYPQVVPLTMATAGAGPTVPMHRLCQPQREAQEQPRALQNSSWMTEVSSLAHPETSVGGFVVGLVLFSLNKSGCNLCCTNNTVDSRMVMATAVPQ